MIGVKQKIFGVLLGGMLGLCATALPALAVTPTIEQADRVRGWIGQVREMSASLLTVFDRLQEVDVLVKQFQTGEISRTAVARAYRDALAQNKTDLQAVLARADEALQPPRIGFDNVESRALEFSAYMREMASAARDFFDQTDALAQGGLKWDRQSVQKLNALSLEKYYWRLRGEAILSGLHAQLLRREDPERLFYKAAQYTSAAVQNMSELAVKIARNGEQADQAIPHIKRAQENLSASQAALQEGRRKIDDVVRKLQRRANRDPKIAALNKSFQSILTQSFAEEKGFADTVEALVGYITRAPEGRKLEVYDVFWQHLPAYLERRSASTPQRHAHAQEAGAVLRAAPRRLSGGGERSIY